MKNEQIYFWKVSWISCKWVEKMLKVVVGINDRNKWLKLLLLRRSFSRINRMSDAKNQKVKKKNKNKKKILKLKWKTTSSENKNILLYKKKVKIHKLFQTIHRVLVQVMRYVVKIKKFHFQKSRFNAIYVPKKFKKLSCSSILR